ncbi:MAG TPA: cupredoxin domain-containing protein [Alphaproteobacteria bacterium]|nr:cupredoxin domain-containing protein [Alphaproteobacteria bacterium]
MSATKTVFGAFALMIINAGFAQAEPIKLDLKDHKFAPAEFTVPANQKFQIQVTNHDGTPAEFESHDLKVEKIIVPGGTVTVTAGPLKPGTYQFFDDYHPDDAHGTVTAKE